MSEALRREGYFPGRRVTISVTFRAAYLELSNSLDDCDLSPVFMAGRLTRRCAVEEDVEAERESAILWGQI